MSWRAVSFVVILGLALVGCDGPSRGTSTQPSSLSGFSVVVTATPNTLQSVQPGSTSDLGGCAAVQAKVTKNGLLVDGALVFFTTNLPAFRQGDEDFLGLSATTINGIATVGFCSHEDRGTAIITATVEDATATTNVTVF
jgi:hypothetical protein